MYLFTLLLFKRGIRHWLILPTIEALNNAHFVICNAPGGLQIKNIFKLNFTLCHRIISISEAIFQVPCMIIQESIIGPLIWAVVSHFEVLCQGNVRWANHYAGISCSYLWTKTWTFRFVQLASFDVCQGSHNTYLWKWIDW